MTIEMVGLLGLLAIIVVGTAVGMLTQRSHEIRDWNGGLCSCGQQWEQYDTDSQGGRGYVCRACHRGMWISYAVDRPAA